MIDCLAILDVELSGTSDVMSRAGIVNWNLLAGWDWLDSACLVSLLESRDVEFSLLVYTSSL